MKSPVLTKVNSPLVGNSPNCIVIEPVPLVENATLPLYESSSSTEKDKGVAVRKKGLDALPPPPPPPQEDRISVIDVTARVLKNKGVILILSL